MTDRSSSPAASRRLRAMVPSPRGLTFALFALAVASAPVAAAGSDRVDTLIERAGRSYQEHDYRRAAALYAEADAAAGGRSPEAVAGLTRSMLHLLRYDDAIAAAERWIELAGSSPASARAFYHLGVALLWRGMSERWQGSPPARRRGGSATVAEPPPARGDDSLRAAVHAFRRAEQEDGGDGGDRQLVLLALADALTSLGEHEAARAALDAYAAAGGGDPWADDLRCSSGGAAPDPAKTLGGDVVAPVKLHAPPPRYPMAARAARVEGVVIVQGILTREGSLGCLRALRAPSYPLAQAAIRAVKAWRFKPARLGDEPVEVYYNLTVNFTFPR